MKVTYIRVSTKEQNTGRQEEMMKKYNIEKVYIEKISGKDTNRPELQAMLNFVREGDIIYIESISRLGRNLKDLLDIVEQLDKKNVGIISIKESHIDTTTPQGKLVFQIFASLAEFEREQIKQRQLEGIAVAKAQGKHLGRPAAEYPEGWKETYNDWKAGGVTAVKAMDLLNIKRSTFYKLVKQYENK